MSEKLILKVENASKKIGNKDILKNISLSAYEGDILGFIGPNGAGKTTTIKLILGLQGITSGKISINGYDVQKEFTKAIGKVGTIVENPDLYMYMSGLDNLKLIANLYPKLEKNRIEEVVKLVGLENRIKDKVSKYSLGMRQRLGIAQAILHKPNLLILDEPTNGLDPEGIKEMRELLINLAKDENMAILISSHNLAELESFCNKITIIQNGTILETNDLKNIKSNTTQTQVLIEVNDCTKVKNIINKINIMDEHNFKIKIQKEEIPSLVEKLIKNNVLVYQVRQEEISLEEAFFKKTGGNVIE